MKNLIILTALVVYVLAKPEGYYYQESSSRSSSSSYKNNELQHQTEDEAFYAKQGDTEGRTVPKINTYNQHIEYQNPNREDYSHSTGFNTQHQNSHGYFGNSDRYSARQALGNDGIVKTVSGNKNHYSYTASYGVSGGEVIPLQNGNYDTQSNLLSITQRLQNDLSRQLQNAITTQRSHSSYEGNTYYVESELKNLERELKANLTRQLQEELTRQYGTQINRGSHAYSIKNGHYGSQANYNTQELQDLSTQVENNLMQQLRNQYQNSQSSGYYSSQHAQQSSRAHTGNYRSSSQFPLNPEVRPQMPLTSVLSQVQNTVDRKLNDALSRIEQQYLTATNAYPNSVPNYDLILDDLKVELKQNLTTTLETILLEYYGAQEEHNNYYYSTRNVASGSKVANYKVDDLNSLARQVENNLIQKLQNSVQQQRQTYHTTRQTYEHTQYNINQNTGYYPSAPKVYTSYAVFTPPKKPSTRYSQSNAHDAETSYTSYGEQYSPDYSPSGNERHTNYGIYRPSSENINYASNNRQTSSDVHQQESQRATQLEYDYSATGGHRQPGKGPTQISQSPYRDTHYSSGTGNNYSPGNANYPTNTGGSPTSSNVYYPTSHMGTYPSTASNYQTSQSNNESSYKLISSQSGSGVPYFGSSKPQTEYQTELINIRDEVRDDISRQLNSAIQKQTQSTSSFSSSSVSNNQVLDELSEELKRNLTQKIEQALKEHYGRNGVRGGYSFTVSSGGRLNSGNYNREQLSALTNQLQDDLLGQLREGLAQESYRQSSSHSSSSYEPVISHGTYGHGANSYNSYSSGSYSQAYSSTGGQGECCIQSDDSTVRAVGTTNQHNQEKHNDSIQKIEGAKYPITRSEQKIERMNINQEEENNRSVEIEFRPPERNEILTSKLVVKDLKQQPTPLIQQENPGRHNHKDENQDDAEILNYFDQQDEFDPFIDKDEQIYDQRSQSSEEFPSINFNQQTTDHFKDTAEEQQVEEQYIEPSQIAQHSIYNQNWNTNEELFEDKLNKNLHQESEAMTQQIEDLSQHADDLTQQIEDLTQQTEDFLQQPVQENKISRYFESEDDQNPISQNTYLTQQTEELNENSERTYQTDNAAQQSENLHQQINQQHFNHMGNKYIPDIYSEYQPSIVPPIGYSMQLNQEQNENGNQNLEPFYRPHHDHQLQNSQLGNTYFSSQLHHGTLNQAPLQSSRSLAEQYPQHGDASTTEQTTYEENLPLEGTSKSHSQQLTNITEKPGFWKKLGGKISRTYHKAKDSITSIG